MSSIIRNASKSLPAWQCSRAFVTTAKSKKTMWSDDLSVPMAADMIGTPDPISNLRPVKYYVPSDETEEQREWRESCQKVDDFNEKFWHANNTLFVEAKAKYEAQLKESGQEITAEAMSIFYKDFLDKAYDRQMEYNRAWWKMNIAQLYPGFKAAIRSLKTKSDHTDYQHTNSKEFSFWKKSFES
ncbi:hypothetical protein BD560DRAFT_391209 [Blakeslea trispora]|nr:hypothetical protein BD560DRAFT_391209 [Blakeslea trispora]